MSRKKQSAERRFVPTGNKVAVVRDAAEKSSPSGIVFTAQGGDRPGEGVVYSVGPGRVLADGTRSAPRGMKPGDRVVFSTVAGTEIDYEGQPLIVLEDHDVLAVVS